MKVERQLPLSFEYDGMRFSEGLRVDLLVDSRVVVEIKSVEALSPVHHKQLLTYLRLLNLPIGLLINFGAAHLREGLKRVVNGLVPSQSPILQVNRTSAPPPRPPREPFLGARPLPGALLEGSGSIGRPQR
jgi:iron complex transport system substrate-binding protein